MDEMGAVWWNARFFVAPVSPQYWNSSWKSRYHVCGFAFRAFTFSIARGPTVIGARLGDAPRHFCVQLPAASTPNASMSIGIPPRLVTQSIATSAPYFRATATIGAMGWHAPVVV